MLFASTARRRYSEGGRRSRSEDQRRIRGRCSKMRGVGRATARQGHALSAQPGPCRHVSLDTPHLCKDAAPRARAAGNRIFSSVSKESQLSQLLIGGTSHEAMVAAVLPVGSVRAALRHDAASESAGALLSAGKLGTGAQDQGRGVCRLLRCARLRLSIEPAKTRGPINAPTHVVGLEQDP